MLQDENTRLSLAGQLESLITDYYYAPGSSQQSRRRCYKAGLQVPLWLWTHEASTKAELKEKELRKATHLVEWVLQQQVEPTRIAVLMPLEWRNDFRAMLSERLHQQYRSQGSAVAVADTPSPTILTHYELTTMQHRDKVQYHYDVVLYVFGLFPSLAAVADARRQEENLTDALAASTHAFILSMDAGWTAPALCQQWTQWRSFYEKLAEEQPFISTAVPLQPNTQEAEERLPSLVGSSLPICCSHHPEQRQLAHGVTDFTLACKHLCRHPYDCGCADHVCGATCHPVIRDHHRVCPYACQKPMSCGHPCLMPCSARCNCYQLVERTLRCCHQEVIGLDKATLEPIYATVQHVFKGVCADQALPCAVQYTTECMRCLGRFTVKCHEAQEQGHTLLHKTMVCDPCKRSERELRASILGEVLCANEEEKKKLKVEMQRTLHEQRKAASQGLFKPGTRVVIRDATRCVPPISAEDDFPGLLFVDMDDANVFTALEGAYGTFVSSHVDVMDNSEVRSLVRLPDGRHVLVTDGGLDMIRALTSQITEAHHQRLLLEAPATAAVPTADAGDTEAATASLPEFAAARALVGQHMYVAQPVPCAAMEDAVLTDKIVQVRAVDPANSQNVLVDCVLCKVSAADAQSPVGEVTGRKRSRSTTDSTTVAPFEPNKEVAVDGAGSGVSREAPSPHDEMETEEPTVVVSCSVPISHLEDMSGLKPGQLVNVTLPERQLTEPRDLELLGAALRIMVDEASTLVRAGETITTVPLNADTSYELVAVMNPPIHMTQKTGPCAILRTRPHAVKVMSPRASRVRRVGRGDGGSDGGAHTSPRGPPSTSTTAVTRLFAVPCMFLAADALTEAEKALDTAAQKHYERRVEDAIQQASEEKALRNEEEEFHRQQQMPEVTPAVQQQPRVAFSVPSLLPTAGDVAGAKVRFNKLTVASSTSTRMMALKDKLVSTQETKARGTFVQSVQERLDKDRLVAKAHLEEVNRRLQGA